MGTANDMRWELEVLSSLGQRTADGSHGLRKRVPSHKSPWRLRTGDAPSSGVCAREDAQAW